MGEKGSVQQIPVALLLEKAYKDEALSEKIVNSFPYPIQIFSPDGTSLMINKAGIEMFGIRKESHVGIYNVFQDPLVRNNGVTDQVRQVLTGKTVYLNNFICSYQDITQYFNAKDRDIETLQADITCFPLMKPDGTVGCFIAIFIIKKIFWFRDEIQKGRDYLNNHWRENFDAKKVAEAANLSKHHFTLLFKKHIGMTPHDYYINIKIRKIQEQLKNPKITISEAFAACNVDYHGHFARVFKKKVGLSPSQYRKTITQI